MSTAPPPSKGSALTFTALPTENWFEFVVRAVIVVVVVVVWSFVVDVIVPVPRVLCCDHPFF
jgi:hypothetical protein